MSVEHLQVTNVFDGTSVRYFQYVTIEHGVLSALSDKPIYAKSEYQHANGWLVPGFVDVQVNGGGGVLFNQTPTLEGLKQMVAAHRQFGTVAMLPTVISDAFDVMEQAANTVSQAMSECPEVVGIHFEGPHLSVLKRGIHVATHICPLSEQTFSLFTRKDLGKVVVTLAPENVSPEQISALVNEGVIVSLGHSNATSQIVSDALQAGATGFTHLFNAMSPLNSREPGMVGEALASRSSYAGLIADFHHVHPTSCQLAINAKGPERIMLVTDAMAHVGGASNALPYHEQMIYRQGTKLTLEDGTLAGSNLDMATAVRNCTERLDVSLPEVFTMASSTPSRFLGLPSHYGTLSVGQPANMVLLDNHMHVKKVWVG